MNFMKAPFPYFGGKSNAATLVWSLFGNGVKNYVEPFLGSAAMLLARPTPAGIETVNDKCGFISNFWRAVQAAPEAVSDAANWPVNEADLEARHAWLVKRADAVRSGLNNPEWYDTKIAGWWVWGACAWLGSGWCEGNGPWTFDDETQLIVDTRQLPHVGDAGRGINRQLPHVGDAGNGNIMTRSEFVREWMENLSVRLRDVRVACGDWKRVTTPSVTTQHGMTALFLDPPYTAGAMQYAAGGVGGALADEVRAWCVKSGRDPLFRIVLCGHAGEHDELKAHGWTTHAWKAGRGYSCKKDGAHATETVWASPACNKGELAMQKEMDLS